MDNFYLTPARDASGEAKRVPDPQTGQPLPAAGAWKQRTQYWLRRVAQGDAIETKPPATIVDLPPPDQAAGKSRKSKA